MILPAHYCINHFIVLVFWHRWVYSQVLNQGGENTYTYTLALLCHPH